MLQVLQIPLFQFLIPWLSEFIEPIFPYRIICCNRRDDISQSTLHSPGKKLAPLRGAFCLLSPFFPCKYRNLKTIHTKKQFPKKHTGLKVMLETYIQEVLALNLSWVTSYSD
jgi:hypothetical protein